MGAQNSTIISGDCYNHNICSGSGSIVNNNPVTNYFNGVECPKLFALFSQRANKRDSSQNEAGDPAGQTLNEAVRTERAATGGGSKRGARTGGDLPNEGEASSLGTHTYGGKGRQGRSAKA